MNVLAECCETFGRCCNGKLWRNAVKSFPRRSEDRLEARRARPDSPKECTKNVARLVIGGGSRRLASPLAYLLVCLSVAYGAIAQTAEHRLSKSVLLARHLGSSCIRIDDIRRALPWRGSSSWGTGDFSKHSELAVCVCVSGFRTPSYEPSEYELHIPAISPNSLAIGQCARSMSTGSTLNAHLIDLITALAIVCIQHNATLLGWHSNREAVAEEDLVAFSLQGPSHTGILSPLSQRFRWK